MTDPPRAIGTFSMVARDPVAHEWGVGVQSKFLAVGGVVPWARAGVGALATQAFANTAFGPEGLHLLAEGHSAQETLELLLADDPQREHRQVGLVDALGRPATFTGRECYAWAGGINGPDFTAQGNILVSGETITAMAETFRNARGALADRLVAALDAAQNAGGDRRGRQSAALLVVKEKGGYGGMSDRQIDLRVDDHPEPLKELARLLGLHKLYFCKSRPEDLVPVDRALTGELQGFLGKAGFYKGNLTGQYDEATQRALYAYMGTENLEERWCEGAEIDPVVLAYLREHC